MSSSPSPFPSGPRQPQQPRRASQSPQSRAWRQPGPPPQRPERGIPDGLIVGLLAVLLGTTALFWAATELGGLVSHGRFPQPLPFLSTAGAIRHLATAPNDLAGAWPGTPAASLPSAAAFWFTFFALLALVLLLLLSAATARAKRRAAHEARARVETPAGSSEMNAATGTGGGTGPAEGVGAPVGPPGQRRRPASPTAGHQAAVPADPSPSGAGAPGEGSQETITRTQNLRAAMSSTAASAWGSVQSNVFVPRASPPPGDGSHPQEPEDASTGGGTPVTASCWASEHPSPAAGSAADGRVVPQGGGNRGPTVPAPAHPPVGPSASRWARPPMTADSAVVGYRTDTPDHLAVPAAPEHEVQPLAGRVDPSQTDAPQTDAPQPDATAARKPAAVAPSGPGVPRPGGPAASVWAQRALATERSTSLRFALPDDGTMCVFAPEAGGLGRRALMSAAVAGATSGPLVVVTGDAGLWDTRPPHRRAARFDPQRLTDDDPDSPRGRWAPHNGCQDAVVATARARALLLPTLRPVADAEERGVRALAETLLRCWLRAASLDHRPFRHVARWAGGVSSGGGSGAGRHEAVTVLQTAAAPVDLAAGEVAWAGQLQAALLQPAPTLDAALGRIRASLGAVAELHVLAACTPESPAAALDPAALLDNGAAGSLYLLGRPGDGRLREPGDSTALAVHSAMPLLSALVDDIVQRVWTTTARPHNAVITPAPVFVLDDIAAVAPFPTLPQLMADGGTRGLRAVTLLRSPEQARSRWGEGAVHSLWTNADHCAVLGPLSPAPLAALLASLGAAEHSVQEALGPEELLVLAGRHRTAPPQRFRISPPVR